MTWPIGFSSLIGCSFLILEEAVNPESAKDSVRYLGVDDKERAERLLKGIVGKRLTYRRTNERHP